MDFLSVFLAVYLALIAYRTTEMGYKAVMRRHGRAPHGDVASAFGVMIDDDGDHEPMLDGVTADSLVEGETEDEAQKQDQRPYSTFVW